MFYNDVTRTWYDPRAPIVGKYAPKPKPATRRSYSTVQTRYIGNVWADATRRDKELARRAAAQAVRRGYY